MLGYSPFYYQTIRKNIIAFGNIFKDIFLIKYNANNRAEIDRRVVPITYAGKENYLSRLLNTPDLPASVEITLPSMSYSIMGLEYDSSRKLQSTLQNFNQSAGSGTAVSIQYNPVPYNIQFELSIYIRNLDDGFQIVEQILPFFTQDYTVSINFVNSMNITRNVPIILDQISMPNDFEGDATSQERRLIWNLNFTMKTYLFGPIITGGLITTAKANTFYLSTSFSDQEGIVLTTSNTAFGNFTIGEAVYQGNSLNEATAIGTVTSWNYSTGKLIISIANGQFLPNANVLGANSYASVEVLNVPQNLLLVSDIETVYPANATPNTDFGFISNITEFPNI